MNMVKQLLIGALVGFIGVWLFIWLTEINFSQYTVEFVSSLLIIVILLWIGAIVVRQQILRLTNMEARDEDEDELEVRKYRKFSDMSLIMQISVAMAVLALCMSMMMTHLLFMISSSVMVLISYMLTLWTFGIAQSMYPERELPSISDPDYTSKLFEQSDDGERFVMAQGLYKTYNFTNVLLILGMVIVTIYSLVTEQSNFFAIFIMAVILMSVNTRYMLAIRHK